jgi:hypothetical protein
MLRASGRFRSVHAKFMNGANEPLFGMSGVDMGRQGGSPPGHAGATTWTAKLLLCKSAMSGFWHEREVLTRATNRMTEVKQPDTSALMTAGLPSRPGEFHGAFAAPTNHSA